MIKPAQTERQTVTIDFDRIIDRRIRHTFPSNEGNETYYEYEVLVSGFDAFPDGLNLEWHPEDEVWKDIEDFYVPRRCATYDNA